MTSLLARIICSGLQTFACFCLSTICGQLYTIGGLNEKSASYGLRDASNGTRSGYSTRILIENKGIIREYK